MLVCEFIAVLDRVKVKAKVFSKPKKAIFLLKSCLTFGRLKIIFGGIWTIYTVYIGIVDTSVLLTFNVDASLHTVGLLKTFLINKRASSKLIHHSPKRTENRRFTYASNKE